MQLTIKTLLCLTLLSALLINGLINHFAARSLQRDLERDGYASQPGKLAKLQQRILMLERATKANQQRTSQLESIGVIIPQNALDSDLPTSIEDSQ